MAKQDASRPEFWDQRYRDSVMPWDAGGVPAALTRFLPELPPRQRVLIPGCGSAYEARAFADAGHDVVAIDFSAAAIASALRVPGARPGTVVFGDFFEHEFGPPFDLVYERAFLCALPRAHWHRYAPRIQAVLRPGGRLAGFFFIDAEAVRGPPFGSAPGELEALLAGGFERGVDEAVSDSLPVFGGKERWQVWTKR